MCTCREAVDTGPWLDRAVWDYVLAIWLMQERQVRNMNATEGRQVTGTTCSGYGRR